MKERVVPKPLAIAAARLGLGFITGFSGFGCSRPPEVSSPPAHASSQNSQEKFRLPFSGTWYLTGGPHYDALSEGVRYGLDFAPPEITPCPSGKFISPHTVEASASGTVKVVGNEKNHSDKNHSIVEIEHGNGISTGYMHLKGITVKAGDKVTRGAPLGKPSCDVPPGGHTTAVHLHLFVKKDGKPVPIDQFTFSDWVVRSGNNNYQGSLISPEGSSRIAAEGVRCGPDPQSIRNCRGTRNEITSEPFTVQGYSNSIPALAAVPTINTPPQKIIPAERPAGNMVDFSSRVHDYTIKYPRTWKLENHPLISSISLKTIMVDAFVGETIEGFRTNVTIFSEPAGGRDLTEYKNLVRDWMKTRERAEFKTDTFARQAINGHDAWEFKVLTYPAAYRRGVYATTLVTVKDNVGWHITLVWSHQGTRDFSIPEDPAFRKMLSSFEFTG